MINKLKNFLKRKIKRDTFLWKVLVEFKRGFYRLYSLILEMQLIFNTWRYEFKHWVQVLFFAYRRKLKAEVCQSKLVSVIIPAVGESNLSNSQQEYYFSVLKKLVYDYLPNQTYKNYEAIVYCDGPNKKVQYLCACLNDPRIKVYVLEKETNLFGHPQTRQGIMIAKGDFFVRMNCDNHPYSEYLETLLNGFEEDIGVVYARTIFKGKARQFHKMDFVKNKFGGVSNDFKAFLLPRDKYGILKCTNIDCMNYMVRMDLAKKYVNSWDDRFAADWFFIASLLENGVKAKFIDRLIGDKL